MTRTGTVTYGSFPLASAADASNQLVSFTINQLLKCCNGRPIDLKTTSEVILDGAVVDNSLGANIRREFDVTLQKDIEILGNEIVSFAIIDRPFTDVTTGNTISF